MIYLTMYNEGQKYSSCVCLDENPEMDKKETHELKLEITQILNLSNSSLKTCTGDKNSTRLLVITSEI